MQSLLGKIEIAFVYGPHAASVMQTKQAINLPVISRCLNEYQLMSLLDHTENTPAQTIRLNVVSPSLAPITQVKKYNSMDAGCHPLPSQIIQKPKIWIKGVESDLGKTA